MIKRRYFARHEKQISVQLWLFIPLKALIKRAAYVIEKTQLLIQRWMFTEPNNHTKQLQQQITKTFKTLSICDQIATVTGPIRISLRSEPLVTNEGDSEGERERERDGKKQRECLLS